MQPEFRRTRVLFTNRTSYYEKNGFHCFFVNIMNNFKKLADHTGTFLHLDDLL